MSLAIAILEFSFLCPPVSDIGNLVFILKFWRNTEMYIFIKYKIET